MATVKAIKAMIPTIIEEVRTEFQKHADPAIVTKYAKYFKEGYDGYGIATDTFQKIEEELFAKYGKFLGRNGTILLGDALFESGKYEEGALAFRLMVHFKSEFDVATFGKVTKWLDHGVKNWAHCDVMCSTLLSIFYEEQIITNIDLYQWYQSPSKWKRRAIPVSLLTFLKLGQPITQLLPDVISLMMDSERVVQQGTGWFLREAWKKEPKLIEKFLLEWKDRSPRLIFQYATEKMTSEQKAKFKKAKV